MLVILLPAVVVMLACAALFVRMTMWMWKTLGVVLLVLALSAGPASAQTHSKLNHVLLATHMGLQGIDNGQSLYLFGKCGERFHEANPLLRPFQQNPTGFGGVKMGFGVTLTLGNMAAERKAPENKWVTIGLVAQNAVLAGVVLHNAQLKC